jgi:hypothetical protein
VAEEAPLDYTVTITITVSTCFRKISGTSHRHVPEPGQSTLPNMADVPDMPDMADMPDMKDMPDMPDMADGADGHRHARVGLSAAPIRDDAASPGTSDGAPVSGIVAHAGHRRLDGWCPVCLYGDGGKA